MNDTVFEETKINGQRYKIKELDCPGNGLDSCSACVFWERGDPNKCTWYAHPDNISKGQEQGKDE